jgi:hypothetical protein
MVVASTNEFRVNQKKYLDMAKQNIQVFVKRGNDLFAITTVLEQQRVDINPVWASHMENAKRDFENGNVTELKPSEVWDKVREQTTD